MANEYLAKPLPSQQEQQDFYQKLRHKVQKWFDNKGSVGKIGKYVLFAPDLFHLLTKMMLDSRIDAKSKGLVGAGILYYIAPLDFLPEIIVGPGGFADDVVVAVFIINTLLNKFPAEIIEEHWAGDEELLSVVRGISSSGSKFASKLPAGRLVKRFLK
ncbi:YkvA family protein [Planococcus sp. YIM B11945]|uniref:YkvA family protein n=1 Tax=Planococcus sp. YIM B11945 TaxID=3435410 RepID=UPI003D7C616E